MIGILWRRITNLRISAFVQCVCVWDDDRFRTAGRRRKRILRIYTVRYCARELHSFEIQRIL